jgi:hypothetical protein
VLQVRTPLYTLLDAKVSGRGSGARIRRNATSHFFRAVRKGMRSGRVRQLSEQAPVYISNDLLSDEEVREVLALRERRAKLWSRSPLVCIGEAEYIEEEGLPRATRRARRAQRAAARMPREHGNSLCFNQTVSASIHATLPTSSTLMVFSGQEPLLDRLGDRIWTQLGLHPDHGYNWQVLSYPNGTAYVATILTVRVLPPHGVHSSH